MLWQNSREKKHTFSFLLEPSSYRIDLAQIICKNEPGNERWVRASFIGPANTQIKGDNLK